MLLTEARRYTADCEKNREKVIDLQIVPGKIGPTRVQIGDLRLLLSLSVHVSSRVLADAAGHDCLGWRHVGLSLASARHAPPHAPRRAVAAATLPAPCCWLPRVPAPCHPCPCAPGTCAPCTPTAAPQRPGTRVPCALRRPAPSQSPHALVAPSCPRAFGVLPAPPECSPPRAAPSASPPLCAAPRRPPRAPRASAASHNPAWPLAVWSPPLRNNRSKALWKKLSIKDKDCPFRHFP